VAVLLIVSVIRKGVAGVTEVAPGWPVLATSVEQLGGVDEVSSSATNSDSTSQLHSGHVAAPALSHLRRQLRTNQDRGKSEHRVIFRRGTGTNVVSTGMSKYL
jgi:hypothetical protein